MLKPRPHPLSPLLRHPLLKDSRFMGLLSLLLPGGSLLAYAHFIETRWLELTHHRIPLRGLKAPLRVLHLSDLHLTREDPWHRAMLAQLQEVSCDLAVITGDVTMPGYDPEVLRSMLRSLPHPRLGRYLSPGNWEYWSGLRGESLQRLADDTDLTLLIDRAVSLEAGLVLAGADSELGGEPDVEKLLSSLPVEGAAVVLSHCPSLFKRLDRAPVQLVLSGHTHGGQLRLPGFGALWLPAGSDHFDQGFFQGQHARLFVHRGFGTSLARLRFACRPEAALLELIPSP